MSYCPSGYFDLQYIDNFCYDGNFNYCWLCGVDSTYESYHDPCAHDDGSGSASSGDRNYSYARQLDLKVFQKKLHFCIFCQFLQTYNCLELKFTNFL
jgi:hypothetical protein